MVNQTILHQSTGLRSQSSTRYWELDLLRFIAISLMVLYHFLFDLYLFFSINIPITDGIYLLIARTSAMMFLLLVGISSVILYDRLYTQDQIIFKFFFVRAAKIMFIALCVTIATYVFSKSETITFGILHLISTSAILSYPLLKSKSKILPLVFAVLIIMVPYFFHSIYSDNPILVTLGITTPIYSSYDFTPIFPWFSLVLLGITIGKIYLPWRKKIDSRIVMSDIIYKASKNSLPIYLLHQPMIIFIMISVKNILQVT